jgi:hypothetical protein
MPIKPENRNLYPANWKLISRRIRFGRAKGRCEQCGALHGQGNLFGRGFVILATAHLNQDPTDNRRSNLKPYASAAISTTTARTICAAPGARGFSSGCCGSPVYLFSIWSRSKYLMQKTTPMTSNMR